MKSNPHPIRSTIVFGLICGLSFIPLSLGLGPLIPWPQALYLPIWLFVAIYSGVLTRWSPAGIQSLQLPLLLILVTLPWIDSIGLFMVLLVATLSWIRSGICFPINLGKRIISEIFLGLIAGGLLAILNPTTLLTWSLAVWMFFLVQALYFVFYGNQEMAVSKLEPDPFEYAREQAENILSNKAQL